NSNQEMAFSSTTSLKPNKTFDFSAKKSQNSADFRLKSPTIDMKSEWNSVSNERPIVSLELRSNPENSVKNSKSLFERIPEFSHSTKIHSNRDLNEFSFDSKTESEGKPVFSMNGNVFSPNKESIISLETKTTKALIKMNKNSDKKSTEMSLG